jgi:hypothetical protein
MSQKSGEEFNKAVYKAKEGGYLPFESLKFS